MGERTGISWTDATFNPWWGCLRVSPGCENCYAETLSKRYGHDVWGPAKTTGRRMMSESYWKAPERWNADPEKHHPQAVAEGRRARVFCASMADVFEDHPAVVESRERLFRLIEATPNLDWQLLTKRPENVMRMVPPAWTIGFPRNVWMGTSAEDQRRFDERSAHLVAIPAAVRFLSCEPLLGPIDLSRWLVADMRADAGGVARLNLLHWCIIGGESGPGARPFDVAWARSIGRQCQCAGVRPFVKQLGANVRDRNDAGFEADQEVYEDTGEWSNPTGWPSTVGVEHDPNGFREEYQGAPVRVRLRDSKGENWTEWPADLRVREFPSAAALGAPA